MVTMSNHNCNAKCILDIFKTSARKSVTRASYKFGLHLCLATKAR